MTEKTTKRMRPEKRDHMLAALLATGASIAEASRELKMHAGTIRRRLQDPAFQKQVADAKEEVYTTILARASGLGLKAIETLESVLDDDTVPAQQVSAASRILSEIRAHRESIEFQQRLADLEEKLEQLASGAPAPAPEPIPFKNPNAS